MKTRIKILTTVMSMFLVLVVMGFAVYAALSGTLTITNTVSFSSENVDVTIDYALSGSPTNATAIKDWDNDGAKTEYPNARVGGTITFSPGNPSTDTWALGAVEFVSDATLSTQIILTFNITNNSSESDIAVYIYGAGTNGALISNSGSNIYRTVDFVGDEDDSAIGTGLTDVAESVLTNAADSKWIGSNPNKMLLLGYIEADSTGTLVMILKITDVSASTTTALNNNFNVHVAYTTDYVAVE